MRTSIHWGNHLMNGNNYRRTSSLSSFGSNGGGGDDRSIRSSGSTVSRTRRGGRRRPSMGMGMGGGSSHHGCPPTPTRPRPVAARRHSALGAYTAKDEMKELRQASFNNTNNRRRTSIGNDAYKYDGPLPGSKAAATDRRRRTSLHGGSSSFNDDKYNYDSLNGANLWR